MKKAIIKRPLTIEEIRNLPFRTDLSYEEEIKELKRNILIYTVGGVVVCTTTAMLMGSTVPLLLSIPSALYFLARITS